jgi:hypothetical protein
MRARCWSLVCAALAGAAGNAGCRAIDGLEDLSFDGGGDAAAGDGAEDAGDRAESLSRPRAAPHAAPARAVANRSGHR